MPWKATVTCKCDWHSSCGDFDTPIEAGVFCAEEIGEHYCTAGCSVVWSEPTTNYYEAHDGNDDSRYEAVVWLSV